VSEPKAALAFSRAQAAFTAALREGIKKVHLTGVVDTGMGACLFALHERGFLTMSELAAAASISRSTMTGIATRMQKRGLIRMAPNPSDGRGTLVALTSRGKATIPKIQRIEEAVDGVIRGVLTPNEIATFAGLLERVASAFSTR
jgi:DNA-binding MarR family transcriptional regulator